MTNKIRKRRTRYENRRFLIWPPCCDVRQLSNLIIIPDCLKWTKKPEKKSCRSSFSRPFALRGHLSFAVMLGGKQIGCYALLWKNGYLVVNTRGKLLKFLRHVWLCSEQKHDVYKIRGFSKKLLIYSLLLKNRSRRCVDFNSLKTLSPCSFRYFTSLLSFFYRNALNQILIICCQYHLGKKQMLRIIENYRDRVELDDVMNYYRELTSLFRSCV